VPSASRIAHAGLAFAHSNPGVAVVGYASRVGPARAAGLAFVALILAPASAGAATNVITTVAGNGTAGAIGDGGPATAAELHTPLSVTSTPDGGFLIADQGNSSVRRVAADGTITTVAGTGTPGFSGDGGPATHAQLNAPSDAALLPDGSIIIADSNNNRIRRVALDGTISTIAGTGAAGFSGDNGPAAAATLSFPADLDVAADGTYFIADNDNNRIRGVSPDGTIKTYAGNGTALSGGDGLPATAASLNGPSSVALIAGRGFLIAEGDGHRIRKVGADGKISTVAGDGRVGSGGDGGPAISASLNQPDRVVATSDGGFLIADRLNNRIRRVGPDGVISSVAGTGTAGGLGDGSPATAAQLNQPLGVAIASDGDYLIADTFNERIRRVDAADAALPPPPPPPAPIASKAPVAHLSVDPDPTCTGVVTRLDASGSTPGSAPIVRYEFEYWEREGLSSLAHRFVLSDGPNSFITNVFTWNTVRNVYTWFDSYPSRDPVDMMLTVTDASGLQDTTDAEITFVQTNNQQSRAGCPASIKLRPVLFSVARATIKKLSVTATTWTLPLPCRPTVPCVGLTLAEIPALSPHRAADFAVGTSTSKRTVIFTGQFFVPAHTTANISGKLTPAGRRLLKRHKSLKVRFLIRLFPPTGKPVTTTSTATLRLPAAHQKHHK
jgi:hypothetical protein